MGDAKRRKDAAGVDLTEVERAAMLGLDPFRAAFALIYGMIEAVYTQSGGVNHELIGIDFANGNPTGVHVLLVERVEDVPRLRDEMLVRWPMVAHVFEAWAAPDDSAPAHAHPERYDAVALMLHTTEFMAAANCRVNESKRTIERGELLMPTEVKGRLGRTVAARPLAS